MHVNFKKTNKKSGQYNDNQTPSEGNGQFKISTMQCLNTVIFWPWPYL